MRFSIDTLTLKKGLDIVNHATASVGATPILENILIKANYNSILLTANNLEMAIEHVITEGVSIDVEGEFSVPSKLFTSYVGLVSEDNISIELTSGDNLILKTVSSDVKIKGIPASDFPLIPVIKEVNSFNIDSNILKKGIEKTLFSAAEGNIRPTLAGIYLNLDKQNIALASTDSFRLSEYKLELNSEIKDDFAQIIPSKTARELRTLIDAGDDIKVITGQNQVAFIFGNTKLYSRLLNGKFPDYSNFFPTSYSTKAVINRVDLIQALKKINLISKENNYSVRMSFSSEQGILMETNETQIGEGKLDLTGSIEGEDSTVGVNSQYMQEVLETIETTHISVSFESALSPIMIKPIYEKEEDKKKQGEFKHIIMPLKI
ncbi:MAG: DNA polymerase III subunit beta [Candidatus Gracilibacteria bacterium]|nr:DNA polymerase III subunit beta [Candidatus Gracilibacteria bacterium]